LTKIKARCKVYVTSYIIVTHRLANGVDEMTKSISIVAPSGMLGYGFPKQSFQNAFNQAVDAIVVDAGSTDAGPHKLGANASIVSDMAIRKDLAIMIEEGIPRNIPIIIGSAGGTGSNEHVLKTYKMIQEILKEKNYTAKIGLIYSEIDKKTMKLALREDGIENVSKNIHPLTNELIDETTRVVAQIGHEKIVEALEANLDIIICGRTYDPSVFAAVGIYHGMDYGLSYHLGKILECGALCAVPGTTKDSIVGTIYEDRFTVQSLNPIRKCTTNSVAAHTFYEKEHPYLLKGPGFLLDLSQCKFNELSDGLIEVRNSKYIHADDYYVKLEGAKVQGYRTFTIAGIRDNLLIERLEEVENEIKQQVKSYFNEINESEYEINFINYGMNGVLHEYETETFSGHEIAVLIDVVASSQEIADAICANVRSTFLHYGYEGRKSTAGNLAFPFAPSDVKFGPVYEFSVYHLMKVNRQSFLSEIKKEGF